MRQVKLTNKKVLSILDKKSALSKETNVILDRMKEIEAEYKDLEAKFNTQLSKTQVIDEKSRPYLQNIIDTLEMGEFEQVSRVHQSDNGEWNIEIVDRLEEFKEAFNKAK